MNKHFLASLGFGAIIALLSIPWLLISSPWLSPASALGLFAQLAIAAYAHKLAPSVAQGLRAAMLALVCGGLLLALPLTDIDRLLGAALTLAVVRSGLLYKRRLGRSLAIEAVLGVSALLFGRMLYGGTLLSTALAIWAFFLVHSLFFLIAAESHTSKATPEDRFKRARDQALELMH